MRNLIARWFPTPAERGRQAFLHLMRETGLSEEEVATRSRLRPESIRELRMGIRSFSDYEAARVSEAIGVLWPWSFTGESRSSWEARWPPRYDSGLEAECRRSAQSEKALENLNRVRATRRNWIRGWASEPKGGA